MPARNAFGECHAPVADDPPSNDLASDAQPGALRVRFNENFPRGAATPRERWRSKIPVQLKHDPALPAAR